MNELCLREAAFWKSPETEKIQINAGMNRLTGFKRKLIEC